MGDNRDRSADSRFSLGRQGPWRAGAVGEYRRPRRVHHLQPRRHDPAHRAVDLVHGLPRGPRRQLRCAPTRNRIQTWPTNAMPHMHDTRPGPTDIHDSPVVREAKRAAVWIGMVLLVMGCIVACPADDADHRRAGVRGDPRRRHAPARAGAADRARLAAGDRHASPASPSSAGPFIYAGTTLAGQATELRGVVTEQGNRVMVYLRQTGLMPNGDMSQLGSQLLGGVGRLTTALSTAFGALSSILMILVIGIFIAIEPKLYDRGVAWMLPTEHRDGFYESVEQGRLHAAPADVRADRRHGGRGRRHLADADVGRRADGGAARPADRSARLRPQHRRDRVGRADGRGRLFGRDRRRAVGDRDLFHRPDDRWLSHRALMSRGARSTWRRRWCWRRSCCSGCCSG